MTWQGQWWNESAAHNASWDLQYSLSEQDMACCRALPEALVSPLADNALVKTIPLEHFPRDLFMIGRSLMILRGLTHALGMDVKVAHHQAYLV